MSAETSPDHPLIHPGVFCCEHKANCTRQGFVLHQGLGWGTVPVVERRGWAASHREICGGRLIQLVEPTPVGPKQDQAIATRPGKITDGFNGGNYELKRAIRSLIERDSVRLAALGMGDYPRIILEACHCRLPDSKPDENKRPIHSWDEPSFGSLND